MSYSYVAYSPQYRREVLDLQRLLWSADIAVNDAYFAWKYEHNPYLANPIVSLALHERRVVGMRGAWGSLWRTRNGAEPAAIPCAGDTVIARDHRGRGALRGLNRSLLEMLEEAGFRNVLSLSASRPVFHNSIRNGWLPMIDYDSLMRAAPLFKHRWIRKNRDRLRAALPWRTGPFPAKGRLRRRRSGAPFGVEVHERPPVDAMASLVRRVEQPGAVGHVRDERYISWRYNCPLSRYLFLTAGADSLDGFMVLERRRERHRGTNIVDWDVTSPAVFDRLLSAAIRIAGMDDLHIWAVSVPASLRAILDQRGFEYSGPAREDNYRRCVLVKELGATDDGGNARNSPVGLAADSSWDLRMIYSDDY